MADAKGSWGLWLIAAVPLSFFGYDFQQWVTSSGVYRTEFSGEVVSARPGLEAILDFIDRGGAGQSTSGGRHYLLTLRDDTGAAIKVAVTRTQYQQTLIPSYVVGRAGVISRYRTRDEALGSPDPR